MSPTDLDVIEKIATALAGSLATWGGMRWRARNAQHTAARAVSDAGKALTLATEAARAAGDALRLAGEAARSATAAHKRLDEHEHRITVLEVRDESARREFSSAIDQLRELMTNSMSRVELLVAEVNRRIDRRVDART